MDYGVCNSIRISDHEGKKHLNYRYNLIIGEIDNIIQDKFIRYYFSEKSIDALINQILFDRKLKIKKYGKVMYINFMMKNKRKKENTEGFWKNAKTIHDNIGHNEAESDINESLNGRIAYNYKKYPWD